jgi:membrane protein YqaA with SNARE-associated domain
MQSVRAAFLSFLAYFLTPAGLVVIGVLDASMLFFLPLGVDVVTIIMAARKPEWSWLYALLATIGSTIGSASTYWVGRKIEEKGASRFVSERQLQRIKARLDRGAFVVGALGAVPPPFPFTAFVLGAGAFELAPWAFFGWLALARVVRFGCETALASYYGTRIVNWMKTPMFEMIIGGLIVLAVVGTIVSGVMVWRSARRA